MKKTSIKLQICTLTTWLTLALVFPAFAIAQQPAASAEPLQRGILNGQAIDLPEAVYPSEAKEKNVTGSVNVEVVVSKKGRVIWVKAASGHILLRKSAQDAARKAKFKPLLMEGRAVRFKGLIIYKFLPGEASVSAPKTKLYKTPDYLNLTRRGEPKWERFKGHLWESEKFYPIGWSRDGKFAYYKEPPQEESSEYVGIILIKDLRADKIIWEHLVSRFLENLKEGEPEPSIEVLWKENQKLFSRQLAKHKIIPFSDFKISKPSINYGNDVLKPKLDVKFRQGDDGYYEVNGEGFYGKRGKAVLSMISKKRGKKVLIERTYRHDQDKDSEFKDTLILDLEIAGLLKSPFEPRAAVVVIEILRGHEDSRITRVNIVGSHLTKGFRKIQEY